MRLSFSSLFCLSLLRGVISAANDEPVSDLGSRLTNHGSIHFSADITYTIRSFVPQNLRGASPEDRSLRNENAGGAGETTHTKTFGFIASAGDYDSW